MLDSASLISRLIIWARGLLFAIVAQLPTNDKLIRALIRYEKKNIGGNREKHFQDNLVAVFTNVEYDDECKNHKNEEVKIIISSGVISDGKCPIN